MKFYTYLVKRQNEWVKKTEDLFYSRKYYENEEISFDEKVIQKILESQILRNVKINNLIWLIDILLTYLILKFKFSILLSNNIKVYSHH